MASQMTCGEKSAGFIGGKTLAWPASCGTSVPVVVAVSVHAVALAIAGQDIGRRLVVEPTLLTQKQLRDAGVKTVEAPSAKLPAFGQSTVATAPRPLSSFASMATPRASLLGFARRSSIHEPTR